MKKLIFEKYSANNSSYTLPKTAIDEYSLEPIVEYLRKKDAAIHGFGERDVAQHYKSLLCDDNINSDRNFLFPVLDNMSRLDGFTGVHPYQLADASQGAAELVFTLEHMLCDMFGMEALCFQPTAQTGGMFTALSVIKAYAKKLNSSENVILVGESTDESMVSYIERFGYTVRRTAFDVASVKAQLNADVIGAIIKVPDDKGDFISNISEINELLHKNGCIACCDANNFKSLVGIVRPGDMGFDMVYFDISNMFDISNISGETDSSAFGVNKALVKYMPIPVIDIDEEEQYYLDYNKPDSIGKVNNFYGDFVALIKTIAYILSLGYDGLTDSAYMAKLNKKYCQTDCRSMQEL